MSKINDYIIKKWGARPQIELAKALAKRKGGDYKSYKGYVNKWFRTEQEPGKDYLLDLSQILNVSVESLLRGEDICSEYGDRATAYAAARSGDKYIIDRLFGCEKHDIWLHTRDEYVKSFVDYVIEYDRYASFKTAIELGYGYPHKDGGELCLDGHEYGYAEKEVNGILTKMIIDNDDKDMFIKAFGKEYPKDPSPESPLLVFRNHSFLMKDEFLKSLSAAPKIFEWLTSECRPLSEREREQACLCTSILRYGEDDCLRPVVERIPSVLYGYEHLVDFFAKENLYEPLRRMIDMGICAVRELENAIKDNRSAFRTDVFDYSPNMMVICLKRRASLAFVPYVKDCLAIKHEELRKQAVMINETIDRMRG